MARVTIGIPVYNGADTLERTMRSVLDQSYDDVELLVVDNASTDGTEEICRSLAAEDERVRYVRNPQNIGQNPNFSRVFELAEGEYFRWLGDADWLAPTYVGACVAELEADPGASLVTTGQALMLPDGRALYDPAEVDRPDQDDPVDRLATLLGLFNGSRLWMDPVYSMIRRSSVTRAEPIRPLRFGDQAFACDLVLAGPYRHVAACLSFRAWAPLPKGREATTRYTRRPGQEASSRLNAAAQRLLMMRAVARSVRETPDLTPSQRRRAAAVLASYGVAAARRRVTGAVARRLGDWAPEEARATTTVAALGGPPPAGATGAE